MRSIPAPANSPPVPVPPARDPRARVDAKKTAPFAEQGPATKLLAPGEVLDGRYVIEACLGGGGMATVYRAVHTALEHPVAIKVVASGIREVPGVLARFLREARAATRLRSEHVVRVFDVGTAPNGSPYLVMELLEGKDLGCILDEGTRPTVEEAVDFVLQACEALAEVHGVGIVHRDLKPPNLFITRGPDGLACVKLIDFGISRVDSPLLPKDALALTSPDVAMGSPRYMPPEQMEAAGSVDSRSDIWGLGAILYEMLVGKAPFDGESLWDIYAAAMHEPPRPSSVRSDVPPGIDAVVLRCLRADPRDRYADVASLAAELAPFGNDAAAGRADAVARVLDASRGVDPRERERELEGTLGGHVSRSSSSRIRRHPTSAGTRARRWIAGTGGVALALVAIALAGRPIAHRFASATAPITDPTSSTAAATSSEVGATVTLDSITLVGSPPDEATALDAGAEPLIEPPPAATAPSPGAPSTAPSPTPHRHAAARQQPAAATSAASAFDDTTAEPTLHVTFGPASTAIPQSGAPPAFGGASTAIPQSGAPPAFGGASTTTTTTPTAAPSADDRVLFEDRK